MAQSLRPLSGLDALFLYLESAGTPMHTGSLIELEAVKGGEMPSAESLRTHLIERLRPLPLLRRILLETPLGLGHPMWREPRAYDIADHVKIRTLPKPGSDAVLRRELAKWHAEPLDRARPMWEAIVIDGLQSGNLALYLRSHHALLDGQAGIKVTSALVDLEPRAVKHSNPVGKPEAVEEKRRGQRRAALRSSANELSRWLRQAPEMIRSATRQVMDTPWKSLRESVWVAPRTLFNAQIGARRGLALGSLPLAEVKAVGAACGGSLNDGVMILVADALREWMRRRAILPSKALIAAMPVSVRVEGSDAGNEVSMVQCPLATDIVDRRARAEAIVTATRAIKGRVSAFKDLIPTDFPGIAAPLWVSGLSRLWQRGRLSERLPPLANLIVSNVPGVPVPLYLAGARIRHFFPISIVTHGLGLNITLVSYAGSLEIGIVSDRAMLADPEVILRGMQRALAQRKKDAPVG